MYTPLKEIGKKKKRKEYQWIEIDLKLIISIDTKWSDRRQQ